MTRPLATIFFKQGLNQSLNQRLSDLISIIFHHKMRHLFIKIKCVLIVFLLACVLFGVNVAHAVLPSGSTIVNTAQVSFQVLDVPMQMSASALVRVYENTPAQVILSQLINTPSEQHTIQNERLQATACQTLGQWSTLAPPKNNTHSYTLQQMVDTSVIRVASIGQPIMIRVIDLDQNLDSNQAETVLVTVKSSVTRDEETLRLTETGLSTGEFTGYIQTKAMSVQNPSVSGNCLFTVTVNDDVIVSYTDRLHQETTNSHVSIDPLSRVFDAQTGALINGAILRMIDVKTGDAVQVFDDDGITPFPSQVTSGQTFLGQLLPNYTASQGVFRFPQVSDGQYRLEVIPPKGYRRATQWAGEMYQQLANAPFHVVNSASLGGTFTIANDAVVFMDIPLNPIVGRLELQKNSDRTEASIGDLVQYQLVLKNTDAPIEHVIISDTLPVGFRMLNQQAIVTLANGTQYAIPVQVTGSGALAGRVLRFDLGALPEDAVFTIHYKTIVGVSTPLGKAESRAIATTDDGFQSNHAPISIEIKDELLSHQAILVGRVVDSCEPKKAKGISGIRIQLEDGRFTRTDAEGRWHIEGVTLGSHVVQADDNSLNPAFEWQKCALASSSGSSKTITPHHHNVKGNAVTIDLNAGSLWQVNFYAQPKIKQGLIDPSIPMDANQTKSTASVVELENSRDAGTVATGFDQEWLEQVTREQRPMNRIEFPPLDFIPRTSAIGLAISHEIGLTPRLSMNQIPINGLTYDGDLINTAQTAGITKWRGVPIYEGLNQLKVEFIDQNQRVVNTLIREIYYSSIPANASIEASQSQLVADGKTPIIVALKLTDRYDKPLREGMTGEISLEGQFIATQWADPKERDPFTLTAQRTALKYVVGQQGIAKIQLMPSANAGQIIMKLQLAGGRQETLTTWADVAQREWMLVGIAEHTRYEGQFKSKIQALSGLPEMEKVGDKGRVALFAVGSIDKHTLLTLAYDSDKSKTDAVRNLAQSLRANEHYLVYADQSTSTQGALSSSKLYLRVDRKLWSALYGDFSTALGGSDLVQFNRALTGVKVDYRGTPLRFSAYMAHTGTGYARDEFNLEGNASHYTLKHKNLRIGSDHVKVEVRLRDLSQTVTETQLLMRDLDYAVDYELGEIRLTSPKFASLNSVGQQKNAVLVVEYEKEADSTPNLIAGARISHQMPALWTSHQKASRQGTVGLNLIHDGTAGVEGQLIGTELSLPVFDHFNLNMAFALSNRNAYLTGQTSENQVANYSPEQKNQQAWQIEFNQQTEQGVHRVYMKHTDLDFGLSTLSQSQLGIFNYGLTSSFTLKTGLTQALNLTVNADHSERVADTRQKIVIPAIETTQLETRISSMIPLSERFKQVQLGVTVGAKYSAEQIAGQSEMSSGFGLGELTLDSVNNRWNTRIQMEKAFLGDGLTTVPERWTIGANYKIRPDWYLTATHEWLSTATEQLQQSSLGLRYSPIKGGSVFSRLGYNQESFGRRSQLLSVGGDYRWLFNEDWSIDTGFTHQKNFQQKNAVFNTENTTLPTGYLEDFNRVVMDFNYKQQAWSSLTRVEYRDGTTENRLKLASQFYRKLSDGFAVSSGFTSTLETAQDRQKTSNNLRVAWSLRPDFDLGSSVVLDAKPDGLERPKWVFLHRMDWDQTALKAPVSALIQHKFVSNFHMNRAMAQQQLSFHYGVKYVWQTDLYGEYRGLTHFVSTDFRHDLTPKFDLGLTVFSAFNPVQKLSYLGVGASLGIDIGESIWLSLGYNYRGLKDGFFNESSMTLDGSYMRLRMRFDQDTFHLNKQNLNTP